MGKRLPLERESFHRASLLPLLVEGTLSIQQEVYAGHRCRRCAGWGAKDAERVFTRRLSFHELLPNKGMVSLETHRVCTVRQTAGGIGAGILLGIAVSPERRLCTLRNGLKNVDFDSGGRGIGGVGAGRKTISVGRKPRYKI